jgi:hypothetical protein
MWTRSVPSPNGPDAVASVFEGGVSREVDAALPVVKAVLFVFALRSRNVMRQGRDHLNREAAIPQGSREDPDGQRREAGEVVQVYDEDALMAEV